MAAEVDICNLALAYLGDSAQVVSIYPPDGSAQSGHCSRFFPVALGQLLELHAWGFATTRVALASVTNLSSTWKYAYAAPSDVLNYLGVLASDAADDYSVGVQMANTIVGQVSSGLGNYTPQAFQVEKNLDGSEVILTNQENAVLRYTAAISDASKLTPLATEALARLLASKLAGPVLKGAEGRNESMAQLQLFQKVLEKATESDANQRREKVTQGAPWMVNR